MASRRNGCRTQNLVFVDADFHSVNQINPVIDFSAGVFAGQ